MSGSSKRRECPAAGRVITSAECGSGRISRFACPADCQHNPFAPSNYSVFSGLEAAVTSLAVTRLYEESEANAERMARLRHLARESNPLALDRETMWLMFGEVGPDGRRFVERWAAEGFAGLRNDERVLLQHRLRHRPILFEIQVVRDLQTVEGVDLLSPGHPRLVIVDRGLAGTATRFATYILFGHPTPHYWRTLGAGIEVPEVEQVLPEQVLRETVMHLGGVSDPDAIRAWLLRHPDQLRESFAAISAARYRRTLALSDTVWVTHEYQLRESFASVTEELDRAEGVEVDSLTSEEEKEGASGARVWLEEVLPASVPPGAPRTVLGRVILGRSRWRLEAMGRVRTAELRRRFEACLGDRVEWLESRERNVATEWVPELSEPEPVALIPPRLLENCSPIRLQSQLVSLPVEEVPKAQAMARIENERHRAFLDQASAVLGGLTPRQAARDPAQRDALVRIVKSIVRRHDFDDLHAGRTQDIDWLVRELGLSEILFPAPPRRPIPREAEPRGARAEDGDDFAEEDELGPDESDEDEPPPWMALPPSPPLPAKPLSPEQVLELFGRARKRVDDPDRVREELEASGSFLFEDVDELVGERLKPEESALLLVHLVIVWCCLVREGYRAPEYAAARWAELCAEAGERVGRAFTQDDPDQIVSALDQEPQPALASFALSGYFACVEGLPRRKRPSSEAMLVSAAMLLSLIQVLDETLGRVES